MDWLLKGIAALIPLMLGGLATIAWQNSHALALLRQEYENHDRELAHLRKLVETRMACPAPPTRL